MAPLSNEIHPLMTRRSTDNAISQFMAKYPSKKSQQAALLHLIDNAGDMAGELRCVIGDGIGCEESDEDARGFFSNVVKVFQRTLLQLEEDTMYMILLFALLFLVYELVRFWLTRIGLLKWLKPKTWVDWAKKTFSCSSILPSCCLPSCCRIRLPWWLGGGVSALQGIPEPHHVEHVAGVVGGGEAIVVPPRSRNEEIQMQNLNRRQRSHSAGPVVREDRHRVRRQIDVEIPMPQNRRNDDNYAPPTYESAMYPDISSSSAVSAPSAPRARSESLSDVTHSTEISNSLQRLHTQHKDTLKKL